MMSEKIFPPSRPPSRLLSRPLSLPLSQHARMFIFCAALLGFFTVASSALVSHLPEHAFAVGGRTMAHTANELLSWHTVALLGMGLLVNWLPSTQLLVTGYGFIIGCLCFGCAVFYTALSGIHPGPIAPVGGSILMLAWLNLAFFALRGARRR
ncbi:DUF423 domain-containing protein [Entomobacter blattae]|uniref:DUF423 domain-containing protein n=1 Tax=Entomobacter blattae TaxID=2762277 RepID=A0A7H1NRE1_9PROT|nr:DUF423 domain-containing protein [Entomobacter blattae]QNT78351.1 hypothetical protein JGUZn3_11240 [Entomobacter blattae]